MSGMEKTRFDTVGVELCSYDDSTCICRWYVRDLNTSMGALMGANVNLFGLLIPEMVENLEH